MNREQYLLIKLEKIDFIIHELKEVIEDINDIKKRVTMRDCVTNTEILFDEEFLNIPNEG